MQRRSRRSHFVPLLLSISVLFIVAVWVVSPRLAITGPSLIDDWYALTHGSAEARQLVHRDLPDGIRYYPAWILWNYAQWRLPGAPGSLVGPNLLDLARILVVVAGLTAATSLVLPRSASPTRHALLAALPALLVISTPGFAVDLARFGPQEPLLVGGIAAGGALLWWAASAVVDGRWLRAWALGVPGGALWLTGVYMKETSVCVLIGLSFIIAANGRRLRSLVAALPPRRRVGLAVIASVVVLPLVHVAYEVAKIVARGQLQYGARVHTGRDSLSPLAHGLGHAWDSLGSPVAWLLLGVAAASLAVGLARRRVDWTDLGLVVTALASLEMGVQTGVFPSRYYLASLVLLAVVCVRVLGRISGLDGWVGWLVLAELGLIAVISLALPTLPSGPGRPMTRQASNSRTPLASFAPADAGSRSRGSTSNEPRRSEH